jgi:hypothetical protein
MIIRKISTLFFLIILGMLLSLSSCEKYLEFDEEITDPKIVVNAMIHPDSVFKVHLSRSLSVIDNGELTSIENGTVEILNENGNLIETLTHNQFGEYRGILQPIAGQKYQLNVSANGYKSVFAEDYIPLLVNISNVDTAGVSNLDGYQELKLEISFQDIANIKNYYQIEIIRAQDFDGSIFENPTYLRADDLSTGNDPEYYRYIFFDDILFDGNLKTITVYTEDTRLYDTYIEVRLSSLSESAYKYAKSYQAFSNNFGFGNVFSQPVQVHSNIEKGLGIFAGVNISRKKITF